MLASQIQVADIGMDGLNKLQEKSITLAQASGMSLDAAAESLAGTINQFGTYQTASQWYDVLTKKSETYCRGNNSP